MSGDEGIERDRNRHRMINTCGGSQWCLLRRLSGGYAAGQQEHRAVRGLRHEGREATADSVSDAAQRKLRPEVARGSVVGEPADTGSARFCVRCRTKSRWGGALFF